MDNLVNRFKRYRTIKHIENNYQKKYAFVGMGNHSINNLYPVLDYLHAEIKYVVTRSEQTAKAISENYKNYTGTNDLKMVLNDEEISGVFISANPVSHFGIVKEALMHHKNVFVEKPPCTTKDELMELIELEKNSKGTVLVGFQKRFAPVYTILKQSVKNTSHYSLKYVVGNYPEGDPLLDLFIHPLDTVSYLFGKSEITSLQIIGNKGVQTYFMHLKHDSGAVGNLELSTDFYWSKSFESLYVSADKKIFQTKNTEKLTSMPKPKSILSIPMEKLKSTSIEQTVLYEQNNFLPVREQNQLYASGYFNEIKSFLDICEGKQNKNDSSLTEIVNTYSLIESIQKQIVA